MKLYISDSLCEEKRYIIDVILGEFLGLNFDVIVAGRTEGIRIEFNDRVAVINDTFFLQAESAWMRPNSLPDFPLRALQREEVPFEYVGVEASIPILYGQAEIKVSENSVYFGLDILGSCFFMLSRYEEYIDGDTDEYGRWKSENCIAAKSGFMMRPIVNEYCELLWGGLNHLWPCLLRKKRSFQFISTHDVDRPYKYLNVPVLKNIQYSIEDVFIRYSIGDALKRLFGSVLSKLSRGAYDPYNTFSYILEQSKRRGVRTEFYFITQSTNPLRDADYCLTDKGILKLVGSIVDRDHTVGLHPSFDSFTNGEKISVELEILRRLLSSLGKECDLLGARMHYLRWQFPGTLQALESAGLCYDSTMYFSDNPGFRAGCCYEYPLYNFDLKLPSSVTEFPLVFMDSTFIMGDEEKFNNGTAEKMIRELKDACRLYNGNFISLWHNSNLTTKKAKDLYEYTLDY